MDKELEFISGRFTLNNLPKEKSYLHHYFKTEMQQAFLRYYFMFKDHKLFSEHTGYQCSANWRYQLAEKIEILENLKQKARKNLDFELITNLETGRYEFE